MNNWLLRRFGGIHRTSEIMQVSGIFWTLLGCWLTMLIFDSRKVVLPALGFLTFGDAAAALGGKKWGKHFWKGNTEKSYEGSLCFVIVSVAWALLFLRWKVAIPGAIVGAWIESRRPRWNDNFWVPVGSGLALSVLNLVLGKH